MNRLFIADTHSDTLMRMIDLGYSLNDERLQVSLPRMLRGGHDLQIFACFIDPVVGRERYVSRTLQMIDLLRSEVAVNRGNISLCTTSAEIRKARSAGKKAALLGIEGGHAISNDLSILRCYRQLGVIYMTLTWSNTNDWADSSNDEEKWGGLTQFGHEVVREMNRIRMMVDISHVSDKTFWHVLRTSARPVIASHSSARALCSHPRNMSDEMIRAMVEKGGVLFVNFFPCFLNQGFYAAYEKLTRRLKKKLDRVGERWKHRPEMYTYEEEPLLQANHTELPRVDMSDVVRHIEHVAKVAGIEGVGFGSDFDGTPFMPRDVDDCTALPRICSALRKRGFKPSEIEKIAGGNFLRVFRDVVG
jgi:membrane dipeptidase